MLVISKATNNNTPFGWTLINGASAWQNVTTAGDSATVERAGDSAGTSLTLVSFSNLTTIPDGSFISAVVLSFSIFKANATNPGSARMNAIVGGNTTNGAYHSGNTNGTTYTDNIARPGGGIWTKADLQGLSVTFQNDGLGGAGSLLDIDEFEVQITYTPQSPGFSLLLV